MKYCNHIWQDPFQLYIAIIFIAKHTLDLSIKLRNVWVT